MLVRVMHELDHATKRMILYTAIIIFLFPATPLSGQGYPWFAIDVRGSTGILGHAGRAGRGSRFSASGYSPISSRAGPRRRCCSG